MLNHLLDTSLLWSTVIVNIPGPLTDLPSVYPTSCPMTAGVGSRTPAALEREFQIIDWMDSPHMIIDFSINPILCFISNLQHKSGGGLFFLVSSVFALHQRHTNGYETDSILNAKAS